MTVAHCAAWAESMWEPDMRDIVVNSRLWRAIE